MTQCNQRAGWKFRPRVPELLAIEGWYTQPDGKRIKLSCRFKDILRASSTKHFISCFRPEGGYWKELPARCSDPTWAVIYLPDRSGDFMGRMFVQYVPSYEGGPNVVKMYYEYGNGLNVDFIEELMGKLLCVEVWPEQPDRYLVRG